MGGGLVQPTQLMAQPSQPATVQHISLLQLIHVLLQLLKPLPEVVQLCPGAIQLPGQLLQEGATGAAPLTQQPFCMLQGLLQCSQAGAERGCRPSLAQCPYPCPKVLQPILQAAQRCIPAPKAGVAWRAVREGSLVAPLAAVTAQPPKAWSALALPAGSVTLRALSAQRLTLAGLALQLGVSPVMLLALGTDTATKAEVAAALPRDLIAGRVRGVRGMASTRLTAPRPPQVPEVGCAAVAAPAHHIGSAGAGSCGAVTAAGASSAVGRQRSPRVTATAAAAALQGIAEIARLALGAAGPGGVVQAAAAVPCVRVTGPRVAGVNVVVALAWPAHSPLHLRRPEVARRAAVAAGPGISGRAEAYDVVGLLVSMAGAPVVVPCAGVAGAGTGAALLP